MRNRSRIKLTLRATVPALTQRKTVLTVDALTEYVTVVATIYRSRIETDNRSGIKRQRVNCSQVDAISQPLTLACMSTNLNINTGILTP